MAKWVSPTVVAAAQLDPAPPAVLQALSDAFNESVLATLHAQRCAQPFLDQADLLERVPELLGIPRTRVMAIGDGRNDIDMLEWPSVEGRGVAMGQAPDEVREVANEFTATDLDDGVAQVLSAF